MRVILDTNIWVSALISKDFEWIDSLFVSENIELVFSERLLTESRPREAVPRVYYSEPSSVP